MYVVTSCFSGDCGPEITVLFTSQEDSPAVQQRVRDHIKEEYSPNSTVTVDNDDDPFSWEIEDPRLEYPETIDIICCDKNY